ncbi:hypothetical protein MRB53_015725 [Persea americana]|uniref:Uncharacterized protein n=1 Tax=Persea americana TaxID=3435 RepID=A0ACC2M0B0_PERAE|nr:hypothetical protein MRB53_015725 [Persea americana]
MNPTKLIFITAILACALVMRPTIAISEEEEEEKEQVPITEDESEFQPFELRGASRFLLSKKKTHKTLKCNKNPRICRAKGSPGPYCCEKKCVDLMTDRLNCGVCGHKCKYSEECCRGKCVNLKLDKRNCGRCNNRCSKGDVCVYGLCNYA